MPRYRSSGRMQPACAGNAKRCLCIHGRQIHGLEHELPDAPARPLSDPCSSFLLKSISEKQSLRQCAHPTFVISHFRLAAFSKAAMSILSISISAFMTRAAFALSGSANISPRTTGLICQESPNLSLSQPHRPVDPPSAESFSQK